MWTSDVFCHFLFLRVNPFCGSHVENSGGKNFSGCLHGQEKD